MDEDVTEVRAVDADDPNADLIGFTFTIQGEDPVLWRVTGTSSWGDSNYVEIQTLDGALKTVRATALVRQRKQVEEG